MAKGDRARSMYAGRRPGRAAKAYMRLWAWVGRRRFNRSRLVTLEFRGAKTGAVHSTPLVIVRHDGERYVASMLGDGVAWVRGVRAAAGRAVLFDRGREEVLLVEIPPEQRAPLLKAFLLVAPGARPHMPVDMDAPVEAFEPVAAGYPVFRVTPAPPMGDTALMETQPATDTTDTTAAAPVRDFEPLLEGIRGAPADGGPVELIVLRPDREERRLATEARLDTDEGVVGDSWRARGSSSRPDGSADPEAQVTIMSTRVLAAIEPDRSRWPLAGDQLLADADLSVANLPAGTRLAIGEAVVEVSETPHTGCAKFSARFGSDALRWINGPLGRELRMRGLNARVVQGGAVRVGDSLRKI